MFAVLVPLLFLQFTLLLFRHSEGGVVGLLRSSIQAVILVCVWIYGLTEILSALGAIRFPIVLTLWILINVAMLAVLIRSRDIFAPIRELRIRIDTVEKRILLMLAVFVVIPLGITALYCPPNNWDSLTYHLLRVEFWIRNESVAHFPTQCLRLLYSGPFAEYVIMHIRLLGAGDLLVNFVQYTAYLSTCILAYLITLELGGNSRSRILAVILVATLPMAMLQSTSTQNDLTAGAFICAFAYFGLLAIRFDRKHTIYILFSALALGLALLTKATSYMWLFPLCVLFGVHLLLKMRQNIRRSIDSIAIYIICFVVFLAPFSVRNVREFGHPVGPTQEGFDYRKIGLNENIGIPTTVSNLIKDYLVHFDVFSLAKPGIVNRFGEKIHKVLGLNYYDPKRTYYHLKLKEFRIHEDYSGDFIMAVLVLLTVGLYCFRFREMKKDPKLFLYATAILLAYLLFATILKWQVWGARFQCVFFLLASVPVAILIERRFTNTVRLLMLFSLLYAVPYLVMNQRKPLIPIPQLDHFSILTSTREEIRYIDKPALLEQHHRIVEELAKRDITTTGFVFGKDGWQYNLVRYADIVDPNIEFRYIRYPTFLRSAHSKQTDFGYRAIVTKYQDTIDLFDPEDVEFYKIYGELKLIVFKKAQYLKPI